MPARSARSKPATAALLEMTRTMCEELFGSRVLSMSAWRFDPVPDIRTATLAFFCWLGKLLLRKPFVITDPFVCMVSIRFLTLTRGESSGHSTTLPITQASSWCCRMSWRICSVWSFDTTRAAPTPQLNVLAISSSESCPSCCSHEKTLGTLQV